MGGRARGSCGAVLSFFAPVFLCGPSAIYHWGSIGTSKPHIEVYLCRLLAKNFLGIFCTLYVGYGEAFFVTGALFGHHQGPERAVLVLLRHNLCRRIAFCYLF